MSTRQTRAHGVTPVLQRDYARRTARQQAAFALPLLRPGMELLDLGCGPGTITLGLARAVAPGAVTGLDHDEEHVDAARALAAERGVPDVEFRTGDVRAMPFPDASFDVVFENNLFVHLAEDAPVAAREAHRVLRPGGFLAARDTDVGAAVWGGQSAPMRRFDALFEAWERSRGSEIGLGRRLPGILHDAGFAATTVTVSADTRGTPETVRSQAEMMTTLLDGEVGRFALERALAGEEELGEMRKAIVEWAGRPDAFFANVHVEVVARKA